MMQPRSMQKHGQRYAQRHGRRRRYAAIAGGLVALGLPLLTVPGMVTAETAIAPATRQAMTDAINDEYQARAFYNAVIEKFGPVRPFTNIVQAETRHAQLWKTLFEVHGLPVPEDTFAGQVAAPETLKAACEMGVQAEKANVEMYDRFLATVQEPDLRAAFTQLRRVSQENHLPAFERCVARGGAPGLGQGQSRQGQGYGRGMGAGLGDRPCQPSLD